MTRLTGYRCNYWQPQPKLLAAPAETLVLAPPLELKTPSGKDATLGDYRGKVVVVDFWATWCGPCRKALPENVELMDEYGKDGLVILGVHDSRQGASKIKELANQYKLNYPLFVDDDTKSQKAWNVAFWPTIAVVDRAGIVRAVGLMPSHLRAVVEVGYAHTISIDYVGKGDPIREVAKVRDEMIAVIESE